MKIEITMTELLLIIDMIKNGIEPEDNEGTDFYTEDELNNNKTMTDITKCWGHGCDLKESCYRFTASEGMSQSYFMNSPIKDGKCEYQWETLNTNEK
jgi:hypothetical protein